MRAVSWVCLVCLLPLAAASLRVELYANSVMRGTPRCNITVPNDGVERALSVLCPALGTASAPGSPISTRITGTLTSPSAAPTWYRFALSMATGRFARLWVDDHRLIDAWPAPATVAEPVTGPSKCGLCRALRQQQLR